MQTPIFGVETRRQLAAASETQSKDLDNIKIPYNYAHINWKLVCFSSRTEFAVSRVISWRRLYFFCIYTFDDRVSSSTQKKKILLKITCPLWGWLRRFGGMSRFSLRSYRNILQHIGVVVVLVWNAYWTHLLFEMFLLLTHSTRFQYVMHNMFANVARKTSES